MFLSENHHILLDYLKDTPGSVYFVLYSSSLV